MTTSRWHLGNDVVDLHHRGGGGRANDRRFLARVCSPEEEAAIRSSPDPELALWVHWAGKEAIYKSASKALGAPPVFQHNLFNVVFPGDQLLRFPRASFRGEGSYKGLAFRLSVARAAGAVHAVSWRPLPGEDPPSYVSAFRESPTETRGPTAELREHFSPGEWDCVTHRASALTRIEARRSLAAAHGVSERSLEIRCGPGLPGRRIPTVWMDGAELPLDLTLSHHGRFLAWAFLSAGVREG